MTYKFGTTANSRNSGINIKTIINKNTKELEYLFCNSRNKLEKLTVIEAERQLALENLRKLVAQLQEGRAYIKNQSDFKYFTA